MDEASNLQVIRVSGTVAQIDQLFQLTLTRYKLPGDSTMVAPDQDPAVPEALAPAITAIVGMSGEPVFS